MKNLLMLLFLFSASLSFAQQAFEISGTTPPALNGKMIYLSTLDYSKFDANFKDSVRIENNSFRFSGSIKNPAILATIFLPRPDIGIVQFLLENRPIKITVIDNQKKNLLDSCIFENAPATDQFYALKKRKTGINARIGEHMMKMNAEFAKATDSAKKKMNDELALLRQEEKKITVQYIKENPAEYLSLYSLCYFVTGSKMVNEADSLAKLFGGLSVRLQTLPEGQAYNQRLANARGLKANKPAPVFTSTNVAGKEVSLKQYRGKYVLLDFWASWCGPCIANLPSVKDAYKKYHEKGLEIVAISLDWEREKWLSAIDKHEITWTNVSDLKHWDGLTSKLYEIRVIPQYYLIDPEGKIIVHDANFESITTMLEKVFNKKKI